MQCEWGFPFDYIEDRWTDRQFVLMAERLAERLDRNRMEHQGGGAMKSRDFLRKQGHL